MSLFYLQLTVSQTLNKNSKYAELTSNVICHKSNSVWHCNLSDCGYIHLYDLKVNGVACSLNHPICRHQR